MRRSLLAFIERVRGTRGEAGDGQALGQEVAVVGEAAGWQKQGGVAPGPASEKRGVLTVSWIRWPSGRSMVRLQWREPHTSIKARPAISPAGV